MFFTPVRCLLSLYVLFASLQHCVAQSEPAEPLAARIVESANPILVLNDLNVVKSDIENMFKDAGYGGLWDLADDYLALPDDSGLDLQAGAILYSSDARSRLSTAQFKITDRKKAIKKLAADDSGDVKDNVPFEIESESLVPLLEIMGTSINNAIIVGDRFFALEDEQEKANNDVPPVWKIADAPQLITKLDNTSQEIINRSGLTLLNQIDKNDVDSVDISTFLAEYNDYLSDAEYQWIRELSEIASTTNLAMMGFKYEHKTLHFRSHAQFRSEKSLKTLMNFPVADKAWSPDLGLEANQLALFAAIQMEAFRSSAAARVVPQILLNESGRNGELAFLQGNMLRVLTELIGDSWNDLTAARIALYQNDSDENVGKLAIIGIADARDRKIVMQELRRLSILTSPQAQTAKALQYEAEILRLIEILTGDDANLANRAATRLVLAGPDSVQLLKKTLPNSNQEQRRSIERLLDRINKIDERKLRNQKVIEPGFWTTLNPGLRFEEATGTVVDNPAHTIHVTPDEGKTEAEVAEAILLMQDMFGKQWNQIRVVQVADHFVFMLGSDQELLNRIVKNVESNHSELLKPLSEAKLKPIHGQIQAGFNTTRLINLTGQNQWGIKNVKPQSDFCWTGLNFEPHAASADALIPVKQIVPFFSLGY